MNEWDAAGIVDPSLRASYERCKRLNAEHGKTYYLATLLLPPHKRPYVHALYGFARYADEIVDDLSSTLTDAEKSEWLGRWGDEILADIRVRDERDSARADSPMTMAADAVLLDTTDLSIDAAVERAVSLVDAALRGGRA